MFKSFIEDFYKFKNKILNKENFAYTRYADGEVKLMNGMAVGMNTQAFQSDGWSCQAKMYKLGEDLIESLKHEESNYFYAITSPNQSAFDYEFLIDRIKQPESNITFADLWINGNYDKFKSFVFNELNEPVYVIASEDGANKNLHPLNVCGYYSVPKDCVNYYETNHEKIKNDMKELAKHNDTLFFVSAGPMSEALIHELYSNNSNNRYIDVGSAIDEIIRGIKTRPYMYNNTIYSKEIVTWH